MAGYIKAKISGANEAIQRYRVASTNKAREMGLDGVVCGHIHHPEVVDVEGVVYYNDGDWIENCSALTEDEQGNIKLLTWTTMSTEAEVHSLPTITKATKAHKAA